MTLGADIKLIVKAYLRRKQGAPEDLDDDANLYEQGIVDSLAVGDFIAFLEQEFSIRFEDRHFFDARFNSIAGLAGIIAEMQATAGPGSAG